MSMHTRWTTLYWVFQIEHTVADILGEIESVIGQAMNSQAIEDDGLESSAEFLMQAIEAYLEEAELTHLHLRYQDDVAGRIDFCQLSRTITPHLSVQSEPPADDIKHCISVLTSLAAQVIASAREDESPSEVFWRFKNQLKESQ